MLKNPVRVATNGHTNSKTSVEKATLAGMLSSHKGLFVVLIVLVILVMVGIRNDDIISFVRPKLFNSEVRKPYDDQVELIRFYDNLKEKEDYGLNVNEPFHSDLSHSKCLEKKDNPNTERCIFRVLARFGKDERLYKALLPRWRALQNDYISELQNSLNQDQNITYKVLVVSSVSNTEASVSWFKEWFNKLALNEVGDVFHFALNHFDNKTELWDEIISQISGYVVLRRRGLHCKVEFWKEIEEKLSTQYDYLWLTDDDIELDFFSWRLTRLLLQKLAPIIAHPSIIPARERSRTSDHPELALTYLPIQGAPALAKNERFAEVMTPFIDSKFWPVILHRLKNWDLRSVWCIDCYWSTVANKWGGNTCGIRSPVITIMGSPVVHMNRHSITRIKIKGNHGRRGCIKRYVGMNRKRSFYSGVYEKKILKNLYKVYNCSLKPKIRSDGIVLWSTKKLASA